MRPRAVPQAVVVGRPRSRARRQAFGAGPTALALACLAALLAACTGRPGIISDDGTPAWPGYVEIVDTDPAIPDFDDSIDEALDTGHPLSDSDRDGRGDYTILAVSGGGALGAFGAGVLTGWTEAGTRPDFDIVTGVSTGALTGGLAFLGPDYDPVLRSVYTETSRDDVFALNPFGVFSASLADNGPLRRSVRRIVDEAFLDRVAAEHRKGRRFFVATTDLDRSRLIIWDMGAMALSDHPDRARRFEDVLIASAAVPVLFPPVFVPTRDGGHAMHVDGAVKAPLFVRQHMFDTLQRRGASVPISVHVIVNDTITLDTDRDPVSPRVPGIGTNAIRSLAETVLYRTLVQNYVRSRRAGASFRLANIPDGFARDGDSLAFDPETMAALFEAGRRGAVTGTVWTDEPPFIEDIERIP